MKLTEQILHDTATEIFRSKKISEAFLTLRDTRQKINIEDIFDKANIITESARNNRKEIYKDLLDEEGNFTKKFLASFQQKAQRRIQAREEINYVINEEIEILDNFELNKRLTKGDIYGLLEKNILLKFEYPVQNQIYEQVNFYRKELQFVILQNVSQGTVNPKLITCQNKLTF